MKLRAMLAFAKGKAVMPLALGSAAWLFFAWMNEPQEPVILVGEVMPTLSDDLRLITVARRNIEWQWAWEQNLEFLKIRANLESCARSGCHSNYSHGPTIESSPNL